MAHNVLDIRLSVDGASECGTSYYDEHDPFDYLYNCGTHYSDPVYEAVNKIDRSLNLSNSTDLGKYIIFRRRFWPLEPPIGMATSLWTSLKRCIVQPIIHTGDWERQPLDEFAFTSASSAPPLPPRNLGRNATAELSAHTIPESLQKHEIDRLKIASKLYENVIEDKTYDAELVSFYNMVGDAHSSGSMSDLIIIVAFLRHNICR